MPSKRLISIVHGDDYYEVYVDGNTVIRVMFHFLDSRMTREVDFDDIPEDVKDIVVDRMKEND